MAGKSPMPPALRLLTAALAAILLAAGTAVLASPSLAAPATHEVVSDDATDTLEAFEKRVLRQINRIRVRRELPRIHRFQPCVDNLSERWARRIRRTGELRHRDQDASLSRCNLSWTGETLVRGTDLTPRMAVKAWLGSPSHRAVLLKKRARWAGVGVRVDGDGRVIGVLNFGDPT